MKWLKLLAAIGAKIQRQVLWQCEVFEAVGGNWGQNPTDKSCGYMKWLMLLATKWCQNPTDKSCGYMKWLKLLAANGAKIQRTGLVAI
jgi:hypothetical protein